MKYFHISWHSTKDGPGIRAVLFLQGCNLRCEWCHSPHSHPLDSPVLFYPDYCRQCGACVRACTHGCHTLSEGSHVFCREDCTGCNACVKACFHAALKQQGHDLPAEEMYSKLACELQILKGIGGLTISGGEPMLQVPEVKKLLKLCREHGIHTAVETSACVPKQFFQELEENVDCWLFGLKQTDPALCKEMTGADFNVILENFRYLGEKCPEKLIVRTPLIDPVTSDAANMKTICGLMEEYGIKKIQLLKYNPYTSLYYQALGIPFLEQSCRAVSSNALEEIISMFQSRRIDCTYLT